MRWSSLFVFFICRSVLLLFVTFYLGLKLWGSCDRKVSRWKVEILKKKKEYHLNFKGWLKFFVGQSRRETFLPKKAKRRVMQETQSGFQGHARVFLGKLFWQVEGKIVLAGGKIILAGGKRFPSKLANSWIMECEEFFLPDWSPPDDPA